MTITLKQVRYFIAAVETGQISLAAMEMNISQSAVTAAIQALETQIGARLLDRSAAGVSPTPEGARFLLRARSIEAAVEDAIRSPLASGMAQQGRIRVGVTYTVAGYFLPRYFARFQRLYPGITLDLSERPRVEIEAGLASGDLDLAVMLVSNITDHEELVEETLFRSRRRLWLPVDHPFLKAPEVRLADVAREPYVMLTVDEAHQTAGRYWQKAGLSPQVIFATSSVEAVRSMVAAGTGVTILSDMVYRPWSLEGQRIELRAIGDPVPSMDVGLAWRRGQTLSPPARTFASFMSVAFGGGAT